MDKILHYPLSGIYHNFHSLGSLGVMQDVVHQPKEALIPEAFCSFCVSFRQLLQAVRTCVWSCKEDVGGLLRNRF